MARHAVTPELSVVLPCYNEAGNVEEILARYRALTSRAALELLLVDNGSTDGTAAALAAQLAKPGHEFARSIRVERNVGYGHGLQTGLRAARAPVVAFSHADLQCSPEDLLAALDLYKAQLQRGPCLVKGRRRGRRAAADRAVTFGFNQLAGLVLGLRAADAATGLVRAPDLNAQPKLFSRELVAGLDDAPLGFDYDLFVLDLARRRGLRILEFDVAYEARKWGHSKLAANPWMRLKTAARAAGTIFKLRLS